MATRKTQKKQTAAAATEGKVGKRALECILMPAMFAAKNVRAQRDRLVQLRRRVHQQQRSLGVRAVAADLFEVSSRGLRLSAGYLSACLELAYDNDADLSFANPAFGFVPKGVNCRKLPHLGIELQKTTSFQIICKNHKF